MEAITATTIILSLRPLFLRGAVSIGLLKRNKG